MRAAEPSYDAEAQSRGASLESDGLIHASTVGIETKQCRCVFAGHANVHVFSWCTSSALKSAVCL